MDSILAAPDVRFEAALTAVEEAESIDALQVAITGLLRPYGLKHAVYHALRIPEAEIEQEVIAFTYPSNWVAHYLQRRYFLIDPVVRLGEVSLLPLDWSDIDKSSPTVRRLFTEAEEAGIGRQGLTLPIRGAAGDRAIFTLTSDLSAEDWRAVRRTYSRDMQVIAHYVHARVLAIRSTQPRATRSVLSSREREALQWAAAGKTIDESATILGLSASTVRIFLDSGRHKLECLTKPQAVAKALRLGIITF